ncbi:MAG: hypothetical protein NT041_00490, partial [Candidatus Vogelbacteria bacterium]|nr:hypothetical protein [Candidatus Vogelbacteria bacterium]
QTKLDGYLTTWPIGQKAQEVTLNRFVSWANKDLLVELRDAIKSEYAEAPVIFNTFSFATYDIFKDFLPDKDFILLDTGNEITDVLIIKDNVLAEHFSFPKGKNYLIRELAKNLGTDFLFTLPIKPTRNLRPALNPFWAKLPNFGKLILKRP